MQDGLETAARGGVGEDAAADGGAVEPAVGRQGVGAEGRGDLGEQGAAGPRELARDLVGVQHGHAELAQHLRGGALAGAGAAREGDDQRAAAARAAPCHGAQASPAQRR